MELRHLTAFLAVAEELHFGRAARRLHIAQPPLSYQIRQLEKELGVQLFERSTRRVRLTSSGQAFLGPARRVLDELGSATLAARAGGQGLYGRVTIGFAGASSHDALPRLTREIHDRYPGIELILQGQTYANVAIQRVADGTLDVGFVRLPCSARGVRTRIIADECLVCALPDNHRLAPRNAISLGDLADESFVTFPRSSGSSLLDATVQACQTAGFTPSIVQAAPDSYTILALVAAGVGVTLTLSSCQHIRLDGLVYRPLIGPELSMRAALAWRPDNPSAAVQTVLAVAEYALPSPAGCAQQPASPAHRR